VKKEINPAVIIALIACAVVVVAVSLYRAATGKPAYPGANAPRAGASPPVTGPMTPQQAAARGIPGVNPNAPRPQ